MKALDRQLLSVLSDATIRFVVPIYQRNYAWKEEQWSRLWEDILAIAKKEQHQEHFTGSIVWVAKIQGPDPNSDGNILVDGQQRLTTLSLIILAYAEYAKNHDQAKNGRKLNPTCEEIIDEHYLYWRSKEIQSEQRYKLTLSDVDKSTFMALLDRLETPSTPVPETGSNLIKAFQYFQAKIANLEDPSLLWRGIQRLQIVNVTLEPGKDNPQLVFESMNSTGKKLCHADLIRNYILLGLEIEKQNTLYKNFWREIERTLGTDADENIFDQFIFHYLTLRTSDVVKYSDLYQTFKNVKTTSSDSNPETLLSELLEYAQIYACITMPDKEKDPDIAKYFHDIDILQATPVFPLIMLFYRKWKTFPDKVSREEFITALKYLETYLVYRILCGYASNTLNKYIPKLIKEYKENFRKDNFLLAKPLLATLECERETSHVFPTSAQVVQALEEKDFYRMKKAKFFFEKLENSYSPKNHLPIFLNKTYSIEHIMPQTITPETDWPQMLGDGYEDKYRQYLNRLGNLTITVYNSEMSNASFAEKKRNINREPLNLARTIAHEEIWTYDQINRRTRELAEKLCSIWERPSISQKEIAQYSLFQTESKKKDRTAINHIPLKEFLQSGFLQVNEKLTDKTYEAECFLNRDGQFEFPDGTCIDAPSTAARYAVKLLGLKRSLNGWQFWFIPRLGCSLREAEIRLTQPNPQ